MPELPEVETIRRGLEQYLVDKAIETVDVRTDGVVIGDINAITGAKVMSVRRFGKGLVIDLSNTYSIAIHIKMTGQLIYTGPDVPEGTKVSPKAGGELPNKHTHVIFKLKTQNSKSKSTVQNSKIDQSYLFYNDIRRFGWIKIVKSEKLKEIRFFRELGPEPPIVPGENKLTLKTFSEILKKKKGPIKPLLMDQSHIGGIGNIYANDALFMAKVHPARPSNSLTKDEVEQLFDAISKVMKKGLKVGGASEWQYVNALGISGNYQNFFQVYGKVGKPCVICETPITKITMGGRGTFFCQICQT